MKRFLLLSSIWCPIIAITACSTDTETSNGSTGGQASATGGVPSTTGGTTTTTGGTTTTTGGTTTTTGGTTTTTGGTTTTTGGTTTTTGGTGPGMTGGTTATGGNGGSTGTTGGASTGGSSGGAGTTGGSGGAATGGTSTGGTPGGGSSTGGAGGSQGGKGGTTATGGSAGAGGGGDLIGTVAGKLDGYLFTAPCSDKGTGYDCTNSGCTGNTKTTTQTFTIGGTPGQAYTLSIHVYGIAEGKRYTGGTRRAGGTDYTGDTGGDFLYTGGTDPGSTYNSYEVHVRNQAMTETAVYYLNSINGTEQHSSYALSFDMTLMVVGGGSILFRVYDSNCRQIMNCGPGAGSSTCAKPRTIDVSQSNPAPMNFTQPWVGQAPAGAYGQWVLLDVKSVQ
ncbi:MAG TPA: hypothetical protein VG937_24630 [Polyangiaceae bacterium]|nr:hypothetical protein [Polyangiaceae bacterium]